MLIGPSYLLDLDTQHANFVMVTVMVRMYGSIYYVVTYNLTAVGNASHVTV